MQGRAFQGQELGSEGVAGAGAFESLADPPHMHNLQRETPEIKPSRRERALGATRNRQWAHSEQRVS